MNKVKLQIFLFTALLFVVSCKKTKNHPIPSVPFDIQINLSLPSYQNLNGVGGWAYVNGGLKGILVYRQSYDVFLAWERQSPADPNGSCSSGVIPDSTNFLQLKDPCSSAVFNMIDGSAIAGSDWGLRAYRTQWDGSNVLRIYND